MNGSLKTVEKTFDGLDIRFEVTQFGAMRSCELMKKIQMAMMAAGASPEADMRGAAALLDPSMIVDILAGTVAFGTNDKGEPKKVELNKREKLDAVFNGRVKKMFDLVEFVIEVNFGDFQEGSDLAAPLPKEPSES